MSIMDELHTLRKLYPESFVALQELAKTANDPGADPAVRLICTTVLGEALVPMITESARRELTKPQVPPLSSSPPKYRFVRGARVKISS